MCVSNEQCHRQRKYFLTACRQGNIFPVYDLKRRKNMVKNACRQGNIFPVYDRANARQPGKSLIFLACTADWTLLHDIRKTKIDNCETPKNVNEIVQN